MTDLNNISFIIPTQPLFYQEVIKNSRFIVHIDHTPDIASAKAFISAIKHKYTDANHNCWAYVAGNPNDSQILGFSDDGEPIGTAGKPMLNVLMGSGLGEITAVITRYFGGIKLGTGGLARAYGGSLNHAMDQLKSAEKISKTIIEGISEYSHQALIENILSSYNVFDIEKIYQADVAWKIIIDQRDAPLVISEILDKTSGRIKFNCPD